MIDCAAFIGPYPFRQLPHPDPEVLARVLAREGLRGAWVGYLPSPWHRDPAPGNEALFAALAAHRELLQPAPVVRPDWPAWERSLRDVVERGAVCIRAYPMHWGMGPHDPQLRALALACAEIGVPLLLTVRFEDLRQRHPLDVATDLTAAHVRALARAGDVRLIVTGAGREMLEETHWGLTPDEQQRVFWDFAWIWGPPEEHFAHLLRTIGASRFVYGTHWPLRLTQNSQANLDLLPSDLRASGIIDVERLSSIRKTPT
jgi:predicted TIM-barrel fold metal-dependent hydrolase